MVYTVGKHKLLVDMVLLEMCPTESQYREDKAMMLSMNYCSHVAYSDRLEKALMSAADQRPSNS